jgi:hypothetical protein
MRWALISPNEKIYDLDGTTYLGSRICDVIDEKFEVADPLFWVQVENDIYRDIYYWDGEQPQENPFYKKITSVTVNTTPGGPTIVN